MRSALFEQQHEDAMSNETRRESTAADQLEVHDPRQGRQYSMPVVDGAVRAVDLGAIRADEFGRGLMSYDPAFLNTASCRSAITFVDGDRGILLYRGYPIQELAGQVPFLDVAYLLIHGELPTPQQSQGWAEQVSAGAVLPPNLFPLVESFPAAAHPMSMLTSAFAALGAYHPEAKAVDDPQVRARHVPRFLGAVSSLSGLIHRRRAGVGMQLPKPTGDYVTDFLANLFATDDAYRVEPALRRALDTLFVLQADHEQNCSTNAVRAVGSSRVEPYSALAAGMAALYGPLHGGANEAVIRMLGEIGTVDGVAHFIERVKAGERRLMGFGHRIYKTYDPRASVIKEIAMQVLAVTGPNPKLDVALAVEEIALQDEYFVSRHLYPNVDFYSGLIYEALGLAMDTHTMVFAASRMAGWVAQWLELIDDREQKIARPRQIYVGPARRPLPGNYQPRADGPSPS
jgi:citrate synthase